MNFRDSGTPLQAIITVFLKDRGLTRQAFAKKIGLTKGALSRLEHQRPPRLPKGLAVDRWAKELGLTVADASRLQLAAELTWSPQGVQELVTKLLKDRKQI